MNEGVNPAISPTTITKPKWISKTGMRIIGSIAILGIAFVVYVYADGYNIIRNKIQTLKGNHFLDPHMEQMPSPDFGNMPAEPGPYRRGMMVGY